MHQAVPEGRRLLTMALGFVCAPTDKRSPPWLLPNNTQGYDGPSGKAWGHTAGTHTAIPPPQPPPPTLSQRLLAAKPRAALFFLAKQAADGGLDALLLGGFVQRVLAAVTAAGVAHRAVLGAC